MIPADNGARRHSTKAVELTGLPGAMDGYGKPSGRTASLLPPGFPQPPTTPWKTPPRGTAGEFSSAPWKTGPRMNALAGGLPRPVSHNPTASTTTGKNIKLGLDSL